MISHVHRDRVLESDHIFGRGTFGDHEGGVGVVGTVGPDLPKVRTAEDDLPDRPSLALRVLLRRDHDRLVPAVDRLEHAVPEPEEVVGQRGPDVGRLVGDDEGVGKVDELALAAASTGLLGPGDAAVDGVVQPDKDVARLKIITMSLLGGKQNIECVNCQF